MSQFLEKLIHSTEATAPEVIEYNGVKFQVVPLDIFQHQRIERAALAAAESEMETTAPAAWKEQPGATPGQNRWDEELSALINVMAAMERIAESLKQADGTPIWTTAAEKEKFKGWIRQNMAFWPIANAAIAKKITALVGKVTAETGPKVKKTPSKRK